MSDFEARFTEVETVLAIAERTIDDLNAVVIEQGKKIDVMQKKIQYLLESQDKDVVKPLSEETPPPHY